LTTGNVGNGSGFQLLNYKLLNYKFPVGGNVKYLWILMLIAGLLALAGCGGSQPKGGAFAGNWQFTMAAPSDNSFVGGLQGGFLQQNQNALSGAVVYSITGPPAIGGGNSQLCNSGSAPVTGTINGSNVTLTANAGGQTFTLTGTLSSDGTTLMGTYTSTAGPAANGSPCGTAQSGLQWSARSVPPLTGAVSGNFHSQASDQDYSVTGFLIQGENIGASNATVTGTLTFQGYSCVGSSAHQTVSVTGTISGNTVLLQMFADNGVNIGYIGQSLALEATVSSVAPVVFESVASGGYLLHNTGHAGYVFTSACAESGNICLAMGDGTGCTQPITLSPAAISFPAQLVGSTSTTQTITLTNTDPAGSTLSGLSLYWNPDSLTGFSAGFSDFNGWPSFLELDTCASPPGSTFSLQPNQSCTITVFFSPQESCRWIPDPSQSNGVAPANCPPFSSYAQKAILYVSSPKSADALTKFSVPITGIGQSALAPSTPELDFGAEAVSESSAPQTLSFTNQGMYPVQILPPATGNNACSTTLVTLGRPVQSGEVDGLRVVQGDAGSGAITLKVPVNENGGALPPTVTYLCDFDPSNPSVMDPRLHANFQITEDTCTDVLLYPGDMCTVNVTYVPQKDTSTTAGLDYFLELNTQECSGSSIQPDCEIDSGRFPVELKANAASPLRMSPGAGLDFGVQGKGTPSAPLTITITNDPNDPNSGTVIFGGNTVTGDYTETDTCGAGAGLTPGGSCTMSVVFTPTATGYRQGTITISYTVPSRPVLVGAQTQTVYMRGTGK
jgi:hypothetical protein